MRKVAILFCFAAMAASGVIAGGQSRTDCPDCAVWNRPQEGFNLFGNTYYVGTRGLASILITSPEGHVLIDGGLPESAPLIAANIRQLGLRVEDVKLIVNSHVHFDHAGGIGPLQQLSAAAVAALARSAPVLERGASDRSDPQFGVIPDIPRVAQVRVVADGETLRVGPVEVTAHATGGHTPGGTSWTWRACEGERCLNFVYADSLTPVAADGFRYSDSRDYPGAVADFEQSFAWLERTPCDILLTPHPDASGLWARVDRLRKGESDPLVDREACRRYAASARERLRQRLERERAGN